MRRETEAKARKAQILEEAPKRLIGTNFRLGERNCDFIDERGFHHTEPFAALLFEDEDGKECFVGLEYLWF